MVLMMGPNINFKGVIWQIIPKLFLYPFYLEYWKTTEFWNSIDPDEAERMDDLRLYAFSNSISVTSGQWWGGGGGGGDNEKLCVMEPGLWLKRSRSQAELKPRTA